MLKVGITLIAWAQGLVLFIPAVGGYADMVVFSILTCLIAGICFVVVSPRIRTDADEYDRHLRQAKARSSSEIRREKSQLRNSPAHRARRT